MQQLILGDCIEEMAKLDAGSVDLVLTDPPYGTTACKWDSVIPFEPMWEQVWRVLKPEGAAIFTASQPFTSVLVMSQVRYFKYEWIWEKAVGSNFALLKYMPMKEHESVLVFAKKKHKYYPIKEPRKGSGAKRLQYGHSGSKTGEACGSQTFQGFNSETYDRQSRNPSSVQFFNNRASGDRGDHPTQKPVALMEYLIKTYTNEGETVLDFTMGSGTTGVAAKNLNRKFIGIEKDSKYYAIACGRMNTLPGLN